MYTIGGQIPGGLTNSVYTSSEGYDWTESSPAPSFVTRSSPAVVFNNSIYIIGGMTNNGRVNEIYTTSDGINWTQVNVTGDLFTARTAHSVIVWNGYMYVLGGSTVDSASNSS